MPTEDEGVTRVTVDSDSLLMPKDSPSRPSTRRFTAAAALAVALTAAGACAYLLSATSETPRLAMTPLSIDAMDLASEAAAPGGFPSGPFVLRNTRKNDLCLDDGGATGPNQNRARLYRCDLNSKNQRFVYDDGLLRSASKNDLCLDDAGGDTGAWYMNACDRTNDNMKFVYDAGNQFVKNNICMDDGGGRAVPSQRCDFNNENMRFMPMPAQKRRAKLPVCLFLHGAMVKGARPTVWKSSYGQVTGALRTYWGPYNVWYADLCDEFVYSFAETENFNWMDKHLQDSYSSKATEVIDRGGIVFGHSMANAILAGACYQQGKCVQWYSLGGGYSGQAIGNSVLNILNIAPVLGAVLNDNVYRGFDMTGNGMRMSPHGNKNAMAQVVDSKQLLKGSVCGVKPYGNPKKIWEGSLNPFKLFDFPTGVKVENEIDQGVLGVAMAVAGGLVSGTLKNTGHDDVRNDGLVEVAACAFYRDGGVGGSKMWYGGKGPWPELGPSDTPTMDQTHILASINHLEECGVFTNTPVVMRWMRNMMCKELESDGVSTCRPESIAYEWPAPSGKIGEACNLLHPCQGATLLGAGNFCCSNKGHSICQKKLSDYVGLSWCPNDCQGTWNKPGTCENAERVHWPRRRGEPCNIDTDCDGWLSHAAGCCSGRCDIKKRDWARIYWCPADCVGRIFGRRGTC